jgi:hypothetical protein
LNSEEGFEGTDQNTLKTEYLLVDSGFPGLMAVAGRGGAGYFRISLHCGH